MAGGQNQDFGNGTWYEHRFATIRCGIYDFYSEIKIPSIKKNWLSLDDFFSKMAKFLGRWSVYSTDSETTSFDAEHMNFVPKLISYLKKSQNLAIFNRFLQIAKFLSRWFVFI